MDQWQRLQRLGNLSSTFEKADRRDAYSGLDLSIYVIKNPIQLVRQSL